MAVAMFYFCGIFGVFFIGGIICEIIDIFI